MELFFREIKKCIFLVVQWRIQAGAQQARASSKFGFAMSLFIFYLYPVLYQNLQNKAQIA